MNKVFQVCSYIKHWLTARYSLGYNVHSPFLYDFTRNVIYEDNLYYCYQAIETQRHQLLHNNNTIYVEDYGTGHSKKRKISDIALTSLAKPKEGQLLFRIANAVDAKNILELGTSLGITTAYLTAHSSKCNTTTLEGSSDIINIAIQNWQKLHLETQIKSVQGNIDETLPLILKKDILYDIIYFDANHTYEATIRYFNQCLPYKTEKTIFIVDDIYYSPEMNKAWQEIMQYPEVKATIDLYDIGIVFFNPYFIKKNYKMRW